MRRSVVVWACLLSATVAVACGGTHDVATDAEPEASHECHPFEAAVVPITLGELVVAGRDEDGTLYVIDRDEAGELRVFESEGMTLVRRVVLGTAESGTTDFVSILLTVGAADRTTFTLLAELQGDDAQLARSTSHDPRMIDPAQLEPFELVDAAELEDFTLENLPDQIVIEYFARTLSAELLLVVRPSRANYDSFRLFYGGANDELIERTISSVQRARDGGSTHILFDLDGQPADAFFAIISTPQGFAHGPATLERQGETTSLERVEQELSLLEGVRYECLP